MAKQHFYENQLIGVGQYLFNMRYDMASKILNTEYLYEDRHWIYRFPHPREDKFDLDNICKQQRTWLFTIPRELSDEFTNSSIHGHPRVKAKWVYGEEETTIEIPCFAIFKQEEYPLIVSDPYPDNILPIVIAGEQYYCGAPMTVFACGICGSMFTCEENEVKLLHPYIAGQHNIKVANRIHARG